MFLGRPAGLAASGLLLLTSRGHASEISSQQLHCAKTFAYECMCNSYFNVFGVCSNHLHNFCITSPSTSLGLAEVPARSVRLLEIH